MIRFITPFVASFVFFAPLAEAQDATVAHLDSKKLTVCSAAINSDKEINVFKDSLSKGANAGNFQFVELTKLGTPAGKTSGAVGGWFDRACDLSRAFTGTSICIASGLYSPNSVQGELWTNICALRSARTSDSDRFNLVGEMLISPTRSDYIPDIENFLSKYTATGRPIPLKELAKMNSSPEARDFVLQQIAEKKDFPTLQLKLVRLAKALHWLDDGVARPMITSILAQLSTSDWPKEEFGGAN